MANNENENIQGSEGFLPKVGRNLLRTNVDIVSSLLGTPGDITRLGGTLLQPLMNLGKGLESATAQGLESLTGFEFRPPEQVGPSILPTMEEGVERATQFLPATSQVKEKITQIAPEYFTPKTPGEEATSEFVQDLTSFLHPLFGPIGKAQAAKSLVTAGLGNLAKWGAKEIKLPEGYQEGVKVGTMLMSSLGLNKPNIGKKISEWYQKTAKLLPKGVGIEATNLKGTMKNVLEEFGPELGDASNPGRIYVDKKVANLQNAINESKNTIPVEQAQAFVKDFNSEYRAGTVPHNAKAPMGQLIEGLKDTVMKIKDEYPEFTEAYERGSEMLRTMNTTGRVSDFIKRVADGLKELRTPIAVATGGTGLAVVEGVRASKPIVKFIENLNRSKGIRSAYLDMVKNAAKENATATARSIERLNKEYIKAEKQEQKPRKNNEGFKIFKRREIAERPTTQQEFKQVTPEKGNGQFKMFKRK